MDFFTGLVIAALIGRGIREALKETPEQKRAREERERVQKEKQKAANEKARQDWEALTAKLENERREFDELCAQVRLLHRGKFPEQVGHSILSDLYPLTKLYPASLQGGVYYLLEEIGESLRVFYVGQSKCIHRRLSKHLEAGERWESDPNPKPGRNIRLCKHIHQSNCYYMFALINAREERDRIEREEIAKYKPECNRNSGISRRKGTSKSCRMKTTGKSSRMKTTGLTEIIRRFVERGDLSDLRTDRRCPLSVRTAWIASCGVPIARWEGDVLKILALAQDVATPVRVKHQNWIMTLAKAQGIQYQEVRR